MRDSLFYKRAVRDFQSVFRDIKVNILWTRRISFIKSKKTNKSWGVTPFTGLFRPFLDLLQANVFRSSWNFIWYYRSKTFWHNRNTMSFSDIFVHFVDRSVLAVHQAISASRYRKKVVREIFPISWNDEHEERPRGRGVRGSYEFIRLVRNFDL